MFAPAGLDPVPVRVIATQAGVAPSLAIEHYRSKDGVHAAVDGEVIDVFDAMPASLGR